MTLKILVAAAAALAIASPAAAAVNLVSNGGFESNGGSQTFVLTDWTQGSGFDWFVGDATFPYPAYAGNSFASTGCVAVYCSISQTIATTAGASYTLSFAFNPGDSVTTGGADTQVIWDGATVVNVGIGPRAWTVYSTTVVASGTSTTLTFSGYQNPAWNGVDDVSVTANVPEPAAWALMIAGFGMVGSALRSRRRDAVAA